MPIIQRIEVRCDLMGFWLFYFMENEVEIWKDVVNYEGRYQVSNMGTVRSLIDNKGKFREKTLTKAKNRGGYLYVSLYNGNSRKHKKVHSLVVESFIDKNYRDNGFVVDHINFIKDDNRLSNLCVLSPRENSSKRRLTGTSSFTGVCWYKNNNKWVAQIVVYGKKVKLGYFDCEGEASEYYKNALDCVKEGRIHDIKTKISRRKNKKK